MTFAPEVGTVLDYHVVVQSQVLSHPSRIQESDMRMVVLESDGLVTKLSTRTSNVVDGGVPTLGQPSADQDSFLVYRLYALAESFEAGRTRDGMANDRRSVRDCDAAALRSLLPLGSTPSVTVPCTLTNFVNGAEQNSASYSMTCAYEGRAVVTTPAGAFAVQTISIKYTSGPASSDSLLSFDTTRGVMVSTTGKIVLPSGTREHRSELVRISR